MCILQVIKGTHGKGKCSGNITRFRINQTNQCLRDGVLECQRLDAAFGLRIADLDEASQAHYFVGDQVRKAIEAVGQPYPEDLPPASSIRKMVEERRRASKKQKRVKQAPGDEQGTLF